MNPVSLSGMIRYFLANKRVFILLLLIPFMAFSAWGFFSWKQPEVKREQIEENQVEGKDTEEDAEEDTEKSTEEDIIKELESKLYAELPEDKKEELYQDFPQLVGKKLYHSQERIFIAATDPNRTENMNQFFTEFANLTDIHLDKFNALANEKFNLVQLNNLVKLFSYPEDKILYIRAYGPTEKSAEYLLSVLSKQFYEHAENLPIDITAITLSKSSVDYTKKPFIEAAIERFTEPDVPEEPEKPEETEETSEETDTKEDQEMPSLPRQMIKYASMGLILGLVVSFLVLIFGSSASNRYLSLREWVVAGYPVVGAYQSETSSKLSLDDKLFAQSLLLKEDNAIEQAIFKMIPVFRSDSKVILFFHDEYISRERWKEKFLEYDIDVQEIPLRINPTVFKSLINNDEGLILVSKENFPQISSIIHPHLARNSAIIVVL